MTITRPEIRTGLLVLFSLATLVGAILYLGAPGVFVPMNTYWVYAENAGGIQQGNQVLLGGRRVGQVVKLYSPVPEAERPAPKLETLIEVRVDASAVIYKEVVVYLTQNGLLGEMLIDFTSGLESSGRAENGHTFIAVRVPGLDQAVPAVLEKLDPALKKATETLDSLQRTAESLTDLTKKDGEAQLALAEFRKFGEHLNDLSDESGPLRLSLENLQDMTGPTSELRQSLNNLKSITDPDSDLAKTLKNSEKFTADLKNNKDLGRTLANFRRASQKLDNTVLTLGGQASAIGHNLEQATDTVKHQPWRLIWPSTKKYPEDLAREAAAKRAREEQKRARAEAKRKEAEARRAADEARRAQKRATPAPVKATPAPKLERRSTRAGKETAPLEKKLSPRRD